MFPLGRVNSMYRGPGAGQGLGITGRLKGVRVGITGGKGREMELERQAAQITMVLINCKKFGFKCDRT